MIFGVVAQQKPERPVANIFIVVGQSNARAFDTTGLDVPGGLSTPDSGIKIWNTYTQAWETYVTGTNSDTWNSGATTPQKWGPEAGFAYAQRAAVPAEEVYLVKIAVDATALAAGTGDDWSETSTGELHDDMATELAAAKAALEDAGREPRVRAILRMQGEKDALDGPSTTAFGTNLTALIAAMRAEWASADTPVIEGRISSSTDWTLGYSVRLFQGRVARDTAGVQIVNTDSYTLAGDNKHYVAASVKTLGEDMRLAYAGTYTLVPPRFEQHTGYRDSNITLTNSRATAEGGGAVSSALQLVATDQGLAGKCYWEVLVDARIANLSVGAGKGALTNSFWGAGADNVGYVSGTGAVFFNNAQTATYATYTAGDRVMVAFDAVTGKIWFGKNGSWNGNPAAGTGQAATLSATTTTSYHRFGAVLRRSGDRVSLKVAAADFAYSPPTGFAAI